MSDDQHALQSCSQKGRFKKLQKTLKKLVTLFLAGRDDYMKTGNLDTSEMLLAATADLFHVVRRHSHRVLREPWMSPFIDGLIKVRCWGHEPTDHAEIISKADWDFDLNWIMYMVGKGLLDWRKNPDGDIRIWGTSKLHQETGQSCSVLIPFPIQRMGKMEGRIAAYLLSR